LTGNSTTEREVNAKAYGASLRLTLSAGHGLKT